jgi:uncharacterized protein (DUF1499 family)
MDPSADGDYGGGLVEARAPARTGARFTTAIAVLLGIAELGCEDRAPDTLGPAAGRLAPCFDRANCVNTGDRHPEGIVPLWLDTSTPDAFARATQVVAGMPRVRVITATANYLHAEERTRVLRFVDDLELLLVDSGELLVRSASRVGESDLGVNRRRVERLRSLLGEAGLLREGG